MPVLHGIPSNNRACARSEEHTSELQSRLHLVCRLLLEKKKAGRRGADIYVIDRVTGQWSFSESCRQVEHLDRRYADIHTILIEDAVNGPAISDVLQRKISGSIAVPPEGGNWRAPKAAQPKVEACFFF